MRDKLYDLFIVDRAARTKMYASTWAISSAFGILLLLSGTPVERSVRASSLLTLAALLIWTLVYCAIPHPILHISGPTFVGRRLALTSALYAFAAAFGLSTRRLGAAVLNRRLLTLTRKPILSPPEALRVADSLNAAEKEGFELHTTTKIRVRDAVERSAVQQPTPPFTDAATALVKYTREITPTSAYGALVAAEQYVQQAFRGFPETFDRSKAEMALSAVTRAIESSGPDTNLRAVALVYRAQMYSVLNMPDQALADLEAGMKLGAADLSDIVLIEAFARANRGVDKGKTDDLRRAVELYTLAMRIPPPSYIVGDTDLIYINRVDWFAERARAYYYLGRYDTAIDDLRRTIELSLEAPEKIRDNVRHGLQQEYIMIACSYLHLGRFAEALRAVSEGERITNGGPNLVRLRRDLAGGPSQAQGVLNQIEASGIFKYGGPYL